MKTLIPLCLLLTCALGAAAVVAPGKESSLSPLEVKIVVTAGQSSLNVIHIATLGVTKSLNPELKLLSGVLITDHKSALSKAKTLAEKKGISLPSSSDETAAKAYKELERKDGSEFDTSFLSYLDSSHAKSVKMFEEAQKLCQDAELKAWIDHTLLIIKAHHERIKRLRPD